MRARTAGEDLDLLRQAALLQWKDNIEARATSRVEAIRKEENPGGTKEAVPNRFQSLRGLRFFLVIEESGLGHE